MIFVLIGRSGSGKSSIQKAILNQTCYDEIVTYTTRPKRENEVNGVDYNFIEDPADFCAMMDELVAYKYILANEWHYGIKLNDLKSYANNSIHCVLTLTPSGYNEIKSLMGDFVIGFYINVFQKETLLMRCIKRETDPDVKEICRRFLSDEIDFKDIDYDFIINNSYKTVNDCRDEILNIIRGLLYAKE